MPGCRDVGPAAKGLVLFSWEEQGPCDKLETKQGVLDRVPGQLPGLGGDSICPQALFPAQDRASRGMGLCLEAQSLVTMDYTSELC